MASVIVVGAVALVAGYPGPQSAAEWLGLVVRGSGLAAVGAAAGWLWAARRLVVPAAVWLVAIGWAIVAELASTASHVVVAGERVSAGPPVLSAFTAAWPAFAVAVVMLALGEARVRRRDPFGVRPRWRFAFGIAGSVGLGAGVTVGILVAVQPPILVGGGLSIGAAVGGGVSVMVAFGLATLLLIRPALISPAFVLVAGLVLAAVDAGLVEVGTPMSTYSLGSVGYLLFGLVLGALESLVRLAFRPLRHARSA